MKESEKNVEKEIAETTPIPDKQEEKQTVQEGFDFAETNSRLMEQARQTSGVSATVPNTEDAKGETTGKVDDGSNTEENQTTPAKPVITQSTPNSEQSTQEAPTTPSASSAAPGTGIDDEDTVQIPEGMQEWFANRQANGAPSNSDEMRAMVGSAEYDRVLRSNWYNRERTNEYFTNAYAEYQRQLLEREEDRSGENGSMSPRDENGRVTNGRVTARTSTGVERTMLDSAFLRNALADGRNDDAVWAICRMTGIDPRQVEGKDANGVSDYIQNLISTRQQALDAIVVPAEATIPSNATDEQKEAAEEQNARREEALRQREAAAASLKEAENLAIDFAGVMHDAGSEWDSANNVFTTPSRRTAEELMDRLTATKDKDKVELEAQQTTLQRAAALTGLADLFAGAGEVIRGWQGAPVSARDWRDKYNRLDDRGKQLYDMYIARLEADRKRKHEAAQAQLQANLKLQLEREKAANEAQQADLDRRLKIAIKQGDWQQARELQRLKNAAAAATARINANAKIRSAEIKNEGKEHNYTIQLGDANKRYVVSMSNAPAVFGSVLGTLMSNRFISDAERAELQRLSDLVDASKGKVDDPEAPNKYESVAIRVNTMLKRYWNNLNDEQRDEIERQIVPTVQTEEPVQEEEQNEPANDELERRMNLGNITGEGNGFW